MSDEAESFSFAAAPALEELAAHPLNDLGNAMRFIRMAGGVICEDGTVNLSSAELLFVQGAGWAGWTGRIWDFKLGPRLAERLAHKVAQGLAAQVPLILSRGADARQVTEIVRRAGDATRLSAMQSVAEGYLEVSAEEFDLDPWAFNVRNGTLRFQREPGDGFTVTRSPHDARDRISRMADVDYDKGATCPLWLACLEQWLPEPPVRAYLQRLMGYVVTGGTTEQVFTILQGRGRDGKSTLVGVLRQVMGGYAGVADVRTFLDVGTRSASDASPDLARLSGDCRLVSVSEPSLGAQLAEAMIKTFTGGSPIVARRLHRDLFEFMPKPKVIMECNTLPRIKGDDDGIWRRLRVIRFIRQVPPEEVDRTLADRLLQERSGILNWLLEGVAGYLCEGLNEPLTIRAATEDYRRSSSHFVEWLEDCVEMAPAATIRSSQLFESYKDWCHANDITKPMTQRTFGDALTERRIVKVGKDGDGLVKRSGARLKAPSQNVRT